MTIAKRRRMALDLGLNRLRHCPENQKPALARYMVIADKFVSAGLPPPPPKLIAHELQESKVISLPGDDHR